MASVRLKCPACDVAWNDDPACFNCGQEGVDSLTGHQPSTGPNEAWNWVIDMVPDDDVLYWSGF
jgi:hypothetical protein